MATNPLPVLLLVALPKHQVFTRQAKVLLPLTIRGFPDILNFITPTSIPRSTLNPSSSRHKAALAFNYSTHTEGFDLLDKWFSVRWQQTRAASPHHTPKCKVSLLKKQQHSNQGSFNPGEFLHDGQQLLKHFPAVSYHIIFLYRLKESPSQQQCINTHLKPFPDYKRAQSYKAIKYFLRSIINSWITQLIL